MIKCAAIFLGLLLLASGCATNHANYQVNVGNGNPQLPVQNVQLMLDGKMQNTFKVIAPNKMAAGKPKKGTLPASLTVSWQDPEGESHEKTVRIDATTRPDFTGQLVLQISENNNLSLTEVPSNGTELSTMPWNMPESWEGAVSIPGMDEI